MGEQVWPNGAAWLDARRLSGAQIGIFILSALVGLLDGNDTIAMAIGVPPLAQALHVQVGQMGWALTGSLGGAAVGALVFGSLADRFGVKPVLVAAVLLFGAFTGLTPLARSMPELTAIRLLAGFGLGGATPCFVAMAASYAPERVRGSIVSLVWAAFPLGLLLGGLMNALIVAWSSWEMVFYVGAAIPLILALPLSAFLPESLAFLAARPERRPALLLALQRIAPGETITLAPVTPTDRHVRVGLSQLVADGRLGLTVCLWLILFACFGTTAASQTWLPAILRQMGVPLASAAIPASALGLGALIGMAASGRMIERMGVLRALAVPVLLGAGATVGVGLTLGSLVACAVFMALVGALVGIGASGGIALAAMAYPPEVRSTGTGWVMAMGRLGQVVFPGMFAIMLTQHWEPVAMFFVLGLAPLAAAAVALVLSRLRHSGHAVPADLAARMA